MTGNIVAAFQPGNWSDTTLWYVLIEGVGQRPYNQLPTAEDDVRISSRIVVNTDAVCHDLSIREGGELVGPGTMDSASLTIGGDTELRASLRPAEVRLDGVRISSKHFIGVVGSGMAMLTDAEDAVVIIDDSGIYNQSATLMDVKPEGCGKAYARKVGNMVRYLTLTVRIQRGVTSPYTDAVMVADLYRMAQSPYQVLAYNGSCIIKGYIETIAYDPASVGTAYHVMKVTVAEGER